MHCRLIQGMVPSDKMAAALQGLKANTLPRLKELPGFRGAYWMTDSESGKLFAATFYDSQESIDASREQAEAIRSAGMAAGGVTFESMKEFEVVASTGEKVSSSATHARLTRSQAESGGVDKLVESVNSVVIPAVKDMPGFKGGFWLGDRQSGEGLGATLWDSADTMAQSRPSVDTIRSQASAMSGAQIAGVGEFEIVVRAESPS